MTIINLTNEIAVGRMTVFSPLKLPSSQIQNSQLSSAEPANIAVNDCQKEPEGTDYTAMQNAKKRPHIKGAKRPSSFSGIGTNNETRQWNGKSAQKE